MFISFVRVQICHDIQVDPKKRPILLFIPKLCFTFFFHIFQEVQIAGLGDSFDTNMDPTGRYTKQQRIKVIDAYFAAKSVLLTQRQCRKNFGRSNVPDGRTIQCLVAKFQKIGSMADTHKGRHRSSFGIIPENIQNYGKAMRNPPEKQQPLSNPSLTRNLHFQNISIEDLPR